MHVVTCFWLASTFGNSWVFISSFYFMDLFLVAITFRILGFHHNILAELFLYFVGFASHLVANNLHKHLFPHRDRVKFHENVDPRFFWIYFSTLPPILNILQMIELSTKAASAKAACDPLCKKETGHLS